MIKRQGKAGEKVSKHTHPPRVIYYLTPSTERVTFEGKKPQDFTSKAGEVAYFEGVKLEMANVGTTESHNIVVELKEKQGGASHPK